MEEEFVRMYFFKKEDGSEGAIFTDVENVLLENDKLVLCYSADQKVKRYKDNETYNESGKEVFRVKEKVRISRRKNSLTERIDPNDVRIIKNSFLIPRKEYEIAFQTYEIEIENFKKECGKIYRERDEKIKKIRAEAECLENEIKPKSIEERLND